MVDKDAGKRVMIMAGLPGFEPGLRGPKPPVLSRLYYRPTRPWDPG